MDKQILMIEDDTAFGQPLKDFLEDNDLSVVWATQGKEGLNLFDKFKPAVVLLDVVLPDMDGFAIAKEIQRRNSATPIIFMTGTALDVQDYNKGYQEHFAKNYLAKPINPFNALAQIKSLLFPPSFKSYKIGTSHQIRINSQKLTIDNQKTIMMREKEIEVFSLLLDNLNSVVSRRDIFLSVWKHNSINLNSSLNSCILAVRKIIDENDFLKLTTIYGVGYKLTER